MSPKSLVASSSVAALTFGAALASLGGGAHASEPSDVPLAPAPTLKAEVDAPASKPNEVQLIGHLGYGNGIGVAYERELVPWLGLRAGYSAMHLRELQITFMGETSEPSYVSAHGVSLDLVFKTEGEVAFEASAGATALFGWDDGAVVLPDLFLGARIEPRDSSLTVRVGFGATAVLAGPVQVSVGYRF